MLHDHRWRCQPALICRYCRWVSSPPCAPTIKSCEPLRPRSCRAEAFTVSSARDNSVLHRPGSVQLQLRRAPSSSLSSRMTSTTSPLLLRRQSIKHAIVSREREIYINLVAGQRSDWFVRDLTYVCLPFSRRSFEDAQGRVSLRDFDQTTCLAGNYGQTGFVSYSTVVASSLGQSKRQATGEEPDTTTLTVAVRICPSSAVLFSVFSSSMPSRPSCPRRLRGEKASTLFSAGEDPDSDRPPHCSPTLLPDVPASCVMAHLAAATPFSTECAAHNEPSLSELNGVLGAVEPPTPKSQPRKPVPHDGCPANDLVGPGALPNNW